MKLNLSSMGGGSNKQSGPAQDPLDAGSYPVRIVQMVHMGLQAQRPFEGQEKPPQQEIRVTYEFLDEFMLDEDGAEVEDKPRWVSEEFALHPLDVDRAKSTLRYNAFDPDNEGDGDIFSLVGRAGNLTIVAKQGNGKNKDKVYNNVSGANAMRAKDLKKHDDTPLINPSLLFSVDEPDMVAYGKLPDFVKDKIKAGLAYKSTELCKQLGEDKGDPDDSSDDEDEKEDW